MRRRLARAFAYVTATTAAATGIAHCSATTELIVVVDTDLGAGTEVDEIDVTVDDGAGFETHRSARVGPGGSALPLTLGVTAGGDPGRQVTIRAVARLRGADVASAGLRTNLVEGESKLAHVSICRSCGTTCATTEATGASLPSFGGAAPAAPRCNAPDGDAGPGDSGDDGALDGSADGDAADAGDGAAPLLAYWDFDEDAGPVVFDRSGNGREIGFTGSSVKRAPGIIGGGLQFTRTDAGTGIGSLSCDAWNGVLFGASGTLSFWWRDEDDAPANAIPSSVGLFTTQTSNRDHFFVSRFKQDPSQTLTLGFQFRDLDSSIDDYANGDGGPTKFNVAVSVWTRIVVTWTATSATLRVGKDAGATPVPFYRPWAPNQQNCFFGSHAMGSLDEVRFYSRPLTDAEIADLP